MKLLLVIVLPILAASCYAEFDTLRTQPYYADSSAYVHYPAPWRPTPTSSWHGPTQK